MGERPPLTASSVAFALLWVMQMVLQLQIRSG